MLGRVIKAAGMAGLAGLAVLTAGCGPGGAGSLGPAPSGSAPAGADASAPLLPASQASASRASGPETGTGPGTGAALSVQVWLMRSGRLFPAARTIAVTRAVGRAAVESLLTGPDAAERAAGVTSAIPAGTRLLGLDISGGTATADLSAAIGQAGGSVPARLAQLTYTLTQFPTVRSVRLQVGGTAVTVLGGVPVQAAQTRAMWAALLPPITVNAPFVGQRVRSPVSVAGTADVFEAAVSLRIIGADGTVIARGFTTASCGTGCRGAYAATVPFTVSRAQPGIIEVYQVSARDGSATAIQDIPVTLLPLPGTPSPGD
jgi:hypothetical protein